ncbi:uncharacterized protein BX664DRAFT_325419 [Halteromyces radiatus]|uniref:uncharacterized protein n=1 Tax=Halteromyces radiatus TaxID=101107 RepID=UPI00221FD356|nr:uncharacterized protein BX664DRAFT_325419 [Halteromyces radiatus]KAI8097021.1 hypothetical protein BX664DRAFT_325419 [Halteromyces radiatus]
MMGVFHSVDALDDPLDFGPLHPQGLYYNPLPDYDVKVVKRLIKEGRLAPFYQGYSEVPDIRNGSQVDLLTSASHGLIHSNSTNNNNNSNNNNNKNSSMLAMTARRMSLFLASHIPENVQKYVLYKDTVECPICFLFYPPFINRTRCCGKVICTECFLQLKRSVDSPSLPIPCPFCIQPHLGIVRVPPPWSLHYASFCNRRADYLHDQQMGKRKRLYIYDPDVVLVDHVRPNWQEIFGSSSKNNISSNGTTRRTIVRPLRTSVPSSMTDFVSDVSSFMNSLNDPPEESLVMEYLRSNSSSLTRREITEKESP